MQFRKIQAVLIVLLLALNLFLLNTWQGGQQATDREIPANQQLLQTMASQPINLPPADNRKGYASYIAAKSERDFKRFRAAYPSHDYRQHGDTATLTLRDPVAAPDDNVLPPSLTLKGDKYCYSDIATGDDTDKTHRHYQQQLGQLPVTGPQGSLVLTVRNQQVTAATVRYLTDQRHLGEPRQMLSQNDAIIGLYQFNEINHGDTVSEAMLGYETQVQVNGYDVYLPVWSFKNTHANKQSQRIKINAFTGENLTK